MTKTNDCDWDAYGAGSYKQDIIIDKILAQYKFSKDANVLDMGCGDGNNIIKIARQVVSALYLNPV